MNIMFTGFEFGVTPKGWAAVTGGSIVNTNQYSGTYCLNLPGTAQTWRYSFPSELSEIFLQFRFKKQTLANNPVFFKWKKDGTVLGTLKINTTLAKIEVYTGDTSTKVLTADLALSPATYYQIELRIKIADAGVIAIKIDGMPHGTFNGDTKPGADTAINVVDFIAPYSNTWIDDVVLNDTTGVRNNSWPDGWQMGAMLLDGDGSPLDFTPYPASPTTHYDKLNERPPSGAQYINSTSVDAEDKFTLGSPPAAANQIIAVKVNAWALRGSSTSPTTVKLGVDLGDGLDHLGDALALGTVSTPVEQLFEVKPGDLTPWVLSDLTDLKAIAKTAA